MNMDFKNEINNKLKQLVTKKQRLEEHESELEASDRIPLLEEISTDLSNIKMDVQEFYRINADSYSATEIAFLEEITCEINKLELLEQMCLISEDLVFVEINFIPVLNELENFVKDEYKKITSQ